MVKKILAALTCLYLFVGSLSEYHHYRQILKMSSKLKASLPEKLKKANLSQIQANELAQCGLQTDLFARLEFGMINPHEEKRLFYYAKNEVSRIEVE